MYLGLFAMRGVTVTDNVVQTYHAMTIAFAHLIMEQLTLICTARAVVCLSERSNQLLL
jgi:hypothetical protein